MSLALATRGYLCPGIRLVSSYEPPRITATDPVEVGISGARRDGIEPPVFKAGASVKVDVRGATAQPTAQPPDSPSIVGGRKQKPSIRKAKKD